MRRIIGAVALLMSAATAAGAQGTRSIVLGGTVRDSAGNPLYPGRVVLPGYSQWTSLREDGSYVMPAIVHVRVATLRVRARTFGYLHVDAIVPVDGDTVTLNFTLKRDPRPIEDVYTGHVDSAMIQRARLRLADRFRVLGERSGTYAFAICRPACASVDADTLAEGRLALFASPLDSATLERALGGTAPVAKRLFLDAGKLMFMGVPGNICYVFDRKPSDAPRSVATRHAGALASMNPTNGDAHLQLYRWHDAWHFMTIRFDSNTFFGRGASWTARQIDQILEDDFIGARRIAEADLGICAEAARATVHP